MNNSTLVKTLLSIKDSDVQKSKFDPHAYRPWEYERWILSVERVMDGYHPETARYCKRVSKFAFRTYLSYLTAISAQRVHLQPDGPVDFTSTESRTEMRLRTLLLNVVLAEVKDQCIYQVDSTCAQILYRTMTQAGPADKLDSLHKICEFDPDLLS